MGVWMKRPVISSESVLSVSRAELRRLLKGHLYSDGCRDAGDAGDAARSARLRSSHLVIIIVRLQRTPYRLEHDPCLIVTLSPVSHLLPQLIAGTKQLGLWIARLATISAS